MEAQNKIDIVYVLGSGSQWNNNEIRFSLRSIEKNLEGYRRVWIVGEKPGFIKNVTHIPYPDELVNNADGNIIRKVLRVCQEKGLSSDFLFINDDHLIMKPIAAEDIPPYHKGDLTKRPKEYFEVDFWRGRLWRTMNILVKNGYSALHFDCHTPLVINKEMFPEVIAQFDYSKGIGYTMKSLYGNVVHPDGPLLKGEKRPLFRPYNLGQLIEITNNRSFIAFNDRGLTASLKIWLMKQFPDPSKYERSNSIKEPFFEVINWLNNPEHSYSEGVDLFNMHGSGRKVKKFLAKGENNKRMEKLEYKLKQALNYL